MCFVEIVIFTSTEHSYVDYFIPANQCIPKKTHSTLQQTANFVRKHPNSTMLYTSHTSRSTAWLHAIQNGMQPYCEVGIQPTNQLNFHGMCQMPELISCIQTVTGKSLAT